MSTKQFFFLISVVGLSLSSHVFGGAQYISNFSSWQAEVVSSAGSVQELTTDALNLQLADEVSTPPMSDAALGHVLTFPSSNQTNCPSFSLTVPDLDGITLNDGLIYNDTEQGVEVFVTDTLSIGDADDYVTDAFSITFQNNYSYAVGFFLVENNRQSEDTLTVYGLGNEILLQLSGTELPQENPSGAFIGIVSDSPIYQIAFEQSLSGDDDIGIKDFWFAGNSQVDSDFDGFDDCLELQNRSNPLVRGDTPFHKKITPSDAQSNDQFGFHVKIDNGRIIGSSSARTNGSSGSVYAFNFEGGLASEEGKIIPQSTLSLNQYGNALAIDGNNLIVGNPGNGPGFVYYFELINGEWEYGDVISTGAPAGSGVGKAVAVDGDTMLIVAGAGHLLFVYERVGANWVKTQEIPVVGTNLSDNFGSAISLSGDLAVIGSSDDDEIDEQAGAAYVFQKENGVWIQVQKLFASNGGYRDHFGHSVATDGNTIVVGAPDINIPSPFRWGAVYTFSYIGGVWTEQQILTTSHGSDGTDEFGSAVAVNGNDLFVGAKDVDPQVSLQGAVYYFKKEDSLWNELTYFWPSDVAFRDYFGTSLDLDGKFLVVGSPRDDVGDEDSGSAYIYDLDLDDDGIYNFWETNTGSFSGELDTGSSPFTADTDNDGLIDGDEVNIHGTNPVLADTDSDGIDDGQEIAEGTDPLTGPVGVPAMGLLGSFILFSMLLLAAEKTRRIIWLSTNKNCG